RPGARQGADWTAPAKADAAMKLVATDANPRKNEPAHDLMGYSALQQKKYLEAIDHYKQANPNDIYVRYNMALAQQGAGHAGEARRMFKEVAIYNFNNVNYALIRADAISKSM